MEKAKVVEGTLDLLIQMSSHLREADVQEVKAASGATPEEALTRSFNRSSKCWVAVLRGRPILAFGVAPLSIMGFIGSPWLLATDEILKVRREFIRESKRYVNEMSEGFELLQNYVDARNRVSINWLSWCGFVMEDAEPYGYEGRLFHRFHKQGGGKVICVS